MYKCIITGDVYPDGRRHGYRCPHHSYKEKGLTDEQIVARIAKGSDYPYGGYCCSDCHAIQNVITVPDKSSGSFAVAIVAALIAAGVFMANEWPWFIGGAVGAAAGYWWKIVLKIAIAIAVIGIIIAIATAVLQ